MSPYFTIFYFYFFTTLCKNNMFTINDKDTCISCIIIIHLYYFWKTDIHFSRWPCHHPNHPDSTKQCYLSTGACIESRKKQEQHSIVELSSPPHPQNVLLCSTHFRTRPWYCPCTCTPFIQMPSNSVEKCRLESAYKSDGRTPSISPFALRRGTTSIYTDWLVNLTLIEQLEKYNFEIDYCLLIFVPVYNTCGEFCKPLCFMCSSFSISTWLQL